MSIAGYLLKNARKTGSEKVTWTFAHNQKHLPN